MRDPGAIPARFEARIVELLPLQDEEIVRFVEAWQKRISEIDGWALVRKLDSYPDLKRLCRIPLFLSILLATSGREQRLPEDRGELIETYLQTLFNPELHKHGGEGDVDRVSLRSSAECIAFELLEVHEIGASERKIVDVLARMTAPSDAPLILDKLRRCGVIRSQSPIRYVFPFPIVQEYLAACYLVSHRIHELPARIASAGHRPWAQVIQFALELHPAPDDIVSQVMSQDDDAFATSTRLVGRCVVNGMALNKNTRDEIGRRLAARWPSQNWSLRDRIGHLLLDGWSKPPLLSEIRILLFDRWLLNNGAGEIIACQKDPALTRGVLEQYIEDGYLQFLYPHELKDSISPIADDVFSMCAGVARRPGLSEEDITGVSGLIEFLDPNTLTVSLVESLAADDAVHDRIRLAAFNRIKGYLDARALPILYRALRSDNWRDRSGTEIAISRSTDPINTLSSVLCDNSIPEQNKVRLIENLSRIFPDKNVFKEFIAKAIGTPSITPDYRDFMLLYAASDGNERAMDELVTRLPSLDPQVAVGCISILGHYRQGPLSRQAAKHLSSGNWTATQAVGLASAAATGMTSIFMMDGLRFGELKTTPVHPDIREFSAIVNDWCGRTDLNIWDRMQIYLSSLRLGSTSATSALHSMATKLIADGIDLDGDEPDHAFSSVLSELTSQNYLLDLRSLEILVEHAVSNVFLRAVDMLTAHGSQQALELLIKFHASLPDKGYFLEKIERLSLRLGITIRERSGSLIIDRTA